MDYYNYITELPDCTVILLFYKLADSEAWSHILTLRLSRLDISGLLSDILINIIFLYLPGGGESA
jgi:hypothetical protein